MTYYYEYKYKKGSKVGGHNLENIKVKDGRSRKLYFYKSFKRK